MSIKLTKRGLMIMLSNPKRTTEELNNILMNSNEEALNYIKQRPWYKYHIAVVNKIG